MAVSASKVIVPPRRKERRDSMAAINKQLSGAHDLDKTPSRALYQKQPPSKRRKNTNASNDNSTKGQISLALSPKKHNTKRGGIPRSAKRMVKTPSKGDGVLGSYYRELSRIPLMDAQKEQDYSQTIHDAEVAAWSLITSSVPHSDLIPVIQERMDTVPLPLEPTTLRANDTELNALSHVLKHIKLPKTILKHVRDRLRISQQIRNEYIEANLRLVISLCRKYTSRGVSLEDLIQEGNKGLMLAVGRFDPNRGLRFSTFAVWWIRHAIVRTISDHGRTVRVPVHMTESKLKIEKFRRNLTSQLKRAPTDQELAEVTGLKIEQISRIDATVQMSPTISLDTPTDDEHDPYSNYLADTSQDLSAMRDEALGAYINAHIVPLLTPIEQDIIRSRFGLNNQDPETFQEIGNRYSLSRERIRQIEQKTIQKLSTILKQKRIRPDIDG